MARMLTVHVQAKHSSRSGTHAGALPPWQNAGRRQTARIARPKQEGRPPGRLPGRTAPASPSQHLASIPPGSRLPAAIRQQQQAVPP